MGEVFLAEHPLIGKTVALKVIHQDLAVNQEVVARFINEARAVSAIGNDHIVEVHDFGISPEGAHFFIMEYLQGQTLALFTRNNQLRIDDALHIAAQIAAGLAAAHRANIIHRDLKPDNIMLIDKLGDPLFVKILDFGLAKMLEGDQKLTAMGVVLGTPEFMSPEAAESKGVDGRSDVYSFGVLLFHMLTGRLPFQANSMGEMMVQHVCRTPPVPRSINPAISPSVEQIVLRCLAKAKEERFQSMEELHQALLDPEAYLGGSPPVVRSNGAEHVAPHPAMTRPAPVRHSTMTIGTPYGFNKSRRRARSLALVAIALVSGGSGAAAALLQDKDVEGTEQATLPATSVVGDASANTPGAVAGEPGTIDALAPVRETIRLQVASEPPGALVTDENGLVLGTTPFSWTTAPRDSEVSWRFAAEGYEAMTYRFSPADEELVQVALVAGPEKVGKSRDKKKARQNSKRVGDGVMMPNL